MYRLLFEISQYFTFIFFDEKYWFEIQFLSDFSHLFMSPLDWVCLVRMTRKTQNVRTRVHQSRFQTQKRGSFGRYCDQFQSILFVIRKFVMNEICFYASISCMCFKREDPNHIQYVCIVIYLPYKNNQEREH